MNFVLTIIVSAVALTSVISKAYALTFSYRMKAQEPRACFYVNVTDTSSTMQVYFSTSDGIVDMSLNSPRNVPLHSVGKKANAEVTLKPAEIGEHSVCFSQVGTFTDKTLDIDILLNKDKDAKSAGSNDPNSKELTTSTSKLEKTIDRLHTDLSDMLHTLRYIKKREKRSMDTTMATELLIFYFSLFEGMLMVGMSVLQVTILRTFFSSSRKTRV